jgi:hypothetical protein
MGSPDLQNKLDETYCLRMKYAVVFPSGDVSFIGRRQPFTGFVREVHHIVPGIPGRLPAILRRMVEKVVRRDVPA